LVSAVIHPVGRAKREKERVATKKEEIQRERETDESECQFKRNGHILRGDYRREKERETTDVEYRLQ
jgi:hypothetical protein